MQKNSLITLALFILNLILTAVCLTLLFLTFNFKSTAQDGVLHNYGEWIVEKKSTCAEKGRMYRICGDEGCTHMEWSAMPLSSHNFKTELLSDKKHATVCTDCSAETVSEHEFDENGVCSVCSFIQGSAALKYTFNTTDRSYTVTGLDNSVLTDVIIPSVYNECPVKRIEDNAFKDKIYLRSINIPRSVVDIGSYAFSGCNYLSEITIPDSVTYIGSYALYNCSALTEVTLPKGITYISQGMFSSCKRLSSFAIPDGVTKIKDYAFNNCTVLKDIQIPDSVTDIGASAFQFCAALRSIKIPDGVKTIKSYTFGYCSLLNDVQLPDNLISINYFAFTSCNMLRNLYLPYTLTEIGEEAFSGCTALEKIIIPHSVENIGNYAFRSCNNLTIYCKSPSKPEGWQRYWNNSNRPVIWAY